MSIIQGDHTRRPPTKDEIFAMGNLALRLWSKRVHVLHDPDSSRYSLLIQEVVWNTYGLFDEEGNPLNLENGTG
ncbi:MAG: hypothetical protein IPG53_03395 [Ignavibacteriales bacterium]|nr:hypothetical protein [Ignavibacteriales bacterium]